MKNSKQIQATIDDRNAEVVAIETLIVEEDREPTAEETTAINAWYGTDDETPGELVGLQKELTSAKRREQLKKEIANRTLAPELDKHVAANKTVIPAKAKRHGNLKAYKSAEDAYQVGQFLMATILPTNNPNQAKAMEWCGNNGIEIRNVMTEGTNTAGGFLVPSPMEGALIVLQEQYGVFRSKALNFPMSADTDRAPKLNGGLTVYFPAEAAAITASDLSLDSVALHATPMATLTRVSAQLNEDSVVAMADLITQQVAQAFANSEDSLAFLGDGTSTYGGKTGIQHSILAGSVVTAATGNTAFATLDDADFLAMIGKLPTYAMNPEWYISKAGYADSMARLTTAAGGAGKADMEEDLRPRFHGYPVNFTQVMNSTLTAQTSTEGLCYLGDLGTGAILGTRMGSSVDADSSVYFATNEIALRGWQRIDVQIHETGTASVAGGIIGLTTPGS